MGDTATPVEARGTPTVTDLELTAVAELIRTRAVSCSEITAAVLARIEALDGALGSYARVTADTARAAAAAADTDIVCGRYRGPLHGVPIGVKDLCFTADAVTAGGAPWRGDFRPTFNATVVDRLLRAGAVLVGKLTMTEGAFTGYHPQLRAPLNPWDPATWPGVSSSGSGVAVAAGLCFGATGTDTGGSIRFPAAMCGVTGLKPTWGRVSRYGVLELAGSLDHVGPMARSAADVATMLTVMAGADPLDPTSSLRPRANYAADLILPRAPVVGVDPAVVDRLDSTTQKMIFDVAALLGGLGWPVREVELPDLTDVIDDFATLLAVETAAAHVDTYPTRVDDYGPALSDLIKLGRSVSAMDYHRMVTHRMAFTGLLQRVFSTVDVLLMPGIGLASPTVSTAEALAHDREMYIRLITPTAPFNLSGSPSISLPAGFTQRGTPLGVQFIGRHFSEQLLVRVGHAFQQATAFHRRRPPLP